MYRRPIAVAALLCALGACHPTAQPRDAHQPPAPGPAAKVDSEEQFLVARNAFLALEPDDARRPAQRAELLRWLVAQAEHALSRKELDDTADYLRNAAALFEPAELGGQDTHTLAELARKVEAVARRRGAHAHTILCLAVEIAVGNPGERSAAVRRFRQVADWLYGGWEGGGNSPLAESDELRRREQLLEGREHLIEDLELTARVWPSAFVVDELTRLYLERGADPLAGLAGRRRSPNDFAEIFSSSQRSTLTLDLIRLYVRAARPAELAKLWKDIANRPGDDAKLRTIFDRAFAPQAGAGDVLALANRFAGERDAAVLREGDREVRMRVCRHGARKWRDSADLALCVGKTAAESFNLTLAARSLEAAERLAPTRQDVWELLARVYIAHLGQLITDDNFNVKDMEAELARIERFHADGQARFPGKTVRLSMAVVLREVGQGYYNGGHVADARRYLERSLALEPSLGALELLAQLRTKQNDARGGIALYERALTMAQEDNALHARAKLRRPLADALEVAQEERAAKNMREMALADWNQRLMTQQLRPSDLAEAAIEAGKLTYQMGARRTGLEQLRRGLDFAPDVSSNYAEVLAFLIPRGELADAVDAYHRALGRDEVSEYFKVYFSLWITDLARRAGEPEDPLALAFLRSTDGAKWYADLARWATGRETEARLMARADTPGRKAEAAFYRAMRAVGEGRVDEARKLWRDVVATDMVAFFEYDMAQLFLRLGTAPSAPLLKDEPPPPPRPTPRPRPGDSI